MKTTGLILLPLIMLLASCTSDRPVEVTYLATGAVSPYSLQYLEHDQMQDTNVNPQGLQDTWSSSFTGDDGDILYIAGKYSDPSSALQIIIKVDGKIYKQKFSEGDTLSYLIVSGVVPYE